MMFATDNPLQPTNATAVTGLVVVVWALAIGAVAAILRRRPDNALIWMLAAVIGGPVTLLILAAATTLGRER